MTETIPNPTAPQEFRITPESWDPQAFWGLILDDLALQMTRATYVAWLEPARAIALADGVLTVQVPNESARDWLENRLARTIQKTVDYYSDRPIQICYITSHNQSPATSTSRTPKATHSFPTGPQGSAKPHHRIREISTERT
jgi:chromosomal replication initiation ATPase DnaA